MMITEFGLDTVNAERLRGPSFLLMICDSFDYHAPIVGLLISQPERSCLSIRNRISSIAINDQNFICQILACFKPHLPGKHYPGPPYTSNLSAPSTRCCLYCARMADAKCTVLHNASQLICGTGFESCSTTLQLQSFPAVVVSHASQAA